MSAPPKDPRHVNIIPYTQNRMRNLCYFQEQAAATLLQYPSGMVISGTVTCKETGLELPALAVVPEMEHDPSAHKLGEVPKVSSARRLIVHSDNIPTGQFILDKEATFEDELDWFILRRIEA